MRAFADAWYDGRMLVFLDESFRSHLTTENRFGVLAGIAIPEDIYASVQHGVYEVRRPYHHNSVLRADQEIHTKHLLNRRTFRAREECGFSYHWNLCEELLGYARHQRLTVFGVVCFRSDWHSFVCSDDRRLDAPFQYLFERIDVYMKSKFPRRYAKIVFDDRDVGTNKKNAIAITNFFSRSTIGRGYDSIIRVPMFAVSQGHNYGLQLADLVTTVIAMKFQGHREVDPLWRIVQNMLHMSRIGSRRQSSLKVLRSLPTEPWRNEKGPGGSEEPITGSADPAPNPT